MVDVRFDNFGISFEVFNRRFSVGDHVILEAAALNVDFSLVDEDRAGSVFDNNFVIFTGEILNGEHLAGRGEEQLCVVAVNVEGCGSVVIERDFTIIKILTFEQVAIFVALAVVIFGSFPDCAAFNITVRVGNDRSREAVAGGNVGERNAAEAAGSYHVV